MTQKKLKKIWWNDESKESNRLIQGISKGDCIYINIEQLWKASSGHTDRFIISFAKTYEHELLHTIISQMFPKQRKSIGEEIVVRKLCNESFPKQSRKWYK